MKLTKLISIRGLNFYAFLVCVGLLSYAAYLQFDKGLEPCPLCIIQRGLFFVLGILFLITAIHRSLSLVWHRIWHGLIFLVALLGAGLAGRHVWLQYFSEPGATGGCGPSLEYMFAHLPLSETVKALLTGSGDCAEVHYLIFGLSIPSWTLIAFTGLAAIAFINLFRKIDR